MFLFPDTLIHDSLLVVDKENPIFGIVVSAKEKTIMSSYELADTHYMAVTKLLESNGISVKEMNSKCSVLLNGSYYTWNLQMAITVETTGIRNVLKIYQKFKDFALTYEKNKYVDVSIESIRFVNGETESIKFK